MSQKINNHANLIWSIADKLTGLYKPHEYGLVILPLTVLRRFDCVLEEGKAVFLNEASKIPQNDTFRDKRLKDLAGQKFYNTTKYTFKKLLEDSSNIRENLLEYINSYSSDVKEIITDSEGFNFESHINKLANNDILFIVMHEFSKVDLHPNTVSNIEMGYIFEEVIRRFSESHNEDAGQHYTPREVIRLMVNILFSEDRKILTADRLTKLIYDPTCGTGGMLTVAEEYMRELNKDVTLKTLGQEINPTTYSIAKADILIKGEDANYIKKGNTLTQDHFSNQKFDYIISNPPFGREWKKEEDFVEKEAKKGMEGRFGYGLPPVGDSQMLFLSHAISKMKPISQGGSRVAIIHNGSPLFTGDAGSGPSEIRRHILENDLLEAIIQLPNNIFYNTGITTYLWVLSSHKSENRRNKVQLIDASKAFNKLRKSLGEKKNEITSEQIAEITKIYGEFKEGVFKNKDFAIESKIFDSGEFGYSKIIIENPKKDENDKVVINKKGKIEPDKDLRDTENVPLNEDINEYFEKNVKPYYPEAWIDTDKTKIGYEIPFTRYFYKYIPPRKASDIFDEIKELEKDESKLMKELFEK